MLSLFGFRSTCGEDQEAVQAQKIWKKAIMLVWRAAANHRWIFIFALLCGGRGEDAALERTFGLKGQVQIDVK